MSEKVIVEGEQDAGNNPAENEIPVSSVGFFLKPKI